MANKVQSNEHTFMNYDSANQSFQNEPHSTELTVIMHFEDAVESLPNLRNDSTLKHRD